MRISWITAAAILVSTQASAGLEQGLAECSAKADKLDRLICYDTLAASVSGAPDVIGSTSTATATAAVAATSVTASKTQAIPTTLPANIEDEFGKANLKKDKQEAEKEIDKIYLEIASISKDPYGALKVSFTNGQRWKQSGTKRYKLKAGQTVYIQKGAFGAFYLGVKDKNSTIKVKRLK